MPVIFPWFGPREGEPVHGFARLAEWGWHEVTVTPEGGVTLRFGLSQSDRWATFSPFSANNVVTVTDRLELELILTNTSASQELPVETCLHTYFSVGDIAAVGPCIPKLLVAPRRPPRGGTRPTSETPSL